MAPKDLIREDFFLKKKLYDFLYIEKKEWKKLIT